MTKRVHCRECVYFVQNLIVSAECGYQENVVIEEVDDWLSNRTEYEYIRKPYRINGNCDCKWFKQVTKQQSKKTGIESLFPSSSKLQ